MPVPLRSPSAFGACRRRNATHSFAGHWSLVTGHWSLVTGHWSLVTGHSLDYRPPDLARGVSLALRPGDVAGHVALIERRVHSGFHGARLALQTQRVAQQQGHAEDRAQ